MSIAHDVLVVDDAIVGDLIVAEYGVTLFTSHAAILHLDGKSFGCRDDAVAIVEGIIVPSGSRLEVRQAA